MARKVDKEVLIGFIAEAKSYFPAIYASLETFKADKTKLDALEVAHRHIHTIKGASSMVGLTGLSHIAYMLEESLEEIGAEQLPLNESTAVFLQQTLDIINSYLDDVMTGNLQEQSFIAQTTIAHRRLKGLPEAEDDAAIAAAVAQIQPSPPKAAPAAPTPPPTRPTAPSPDLTLDDIAPELLEAFTIEAEDHLHNIGTAMTALDKDPSQLHYLQAIRRAVHTLKGGAGTVGLTPIAHLAHRMEDMLDLLYEGKIPLTPETMAVLFTSADALQDLLDEKDEDLEARLTEIYGRYNQWLGTTADPRSTPKTNILEPLGEEPTIDLAAMATAATEGQKTKAETAVNQPVQTGEVVRVPLERLDELVRSVSELVITRTTFEQHMSSMVRLVDELWHSFERLRQVSHKLETQYEVTALGGNQWTLLGGNNPNKHASISGFINEFDSLQMDRYTEFHLLTRELTETTSDLRTIGNELRHLIGDFDGVLTRQGRLSSEIQDRLMRTRMVALATIATRLHRAVRVVSQKQGKLVDFVIDGQNIELDKKVLEEMADPLLHVLRNAVDHGIEPPALRQVMGKPEQGEIRLKAYYQGNQVVLEIGDDGAGLEPNVLRTKAVNGGYIAEAEAAQLSNEDLYALLFVPGFSTAEEVSDVSGRGVGLDVLRNSVHKLKGTITVTSQPGKGTTFTIRLPMTLAVARALLVKAHGETFAVPLAAVSQIVRVDRTELEQIGHNEVIRLAGQVYPLHYLGQALHLNQPADETLPRPPVLILDAGSSQVALAVDSIVEEREIVVKTLGNHLRHVHAVTGATLMGDGSIVLILNPTELVAERAQTAVHQWTTVTSTTSSQKALSVLIVDDSVSVRRVVSNLIKNAGWHPTTAKDGLEALTLIQNAAELPDVILLDIEMPRMDGYELTATLQAHHTFQRIPIVMLTSRAGDKHRQKALDLGVTEYVVKPYQDEHLIEIVRRLGQMSRQAIAEA